MSTIYRIKLNFTNSTHYSNAYVYQFSFMFHFYNPFYRASAPYQISSKSDDSRMKYGDNTI